MATRPASVAGIFYPAQGQVLQRHLDAYLLDSPCQQQQSRCPKVLVVPHAGYKYSASIAASAYNQLQPFGKQIKRVVLLGPAHRVPLDGIALPDSDRFATPLGEVEIDAQLRAMVADLPQVVCWQQAHADEHSLEVQLPFLQQLLADFTLLPLVVGRCPAEQVQQLLDLVWGGDETLVVVSSDLSHYLSYTQACRVDRSTSEQLCQLRGSLTGEQACGCYALNGLMAQLRQRGMAVELLDLRNSGDTAGDHQRVVGYGAFAAY